MNPGLFSQFPQYEYNTHADSSFLSASYPTKMKHFVIVFTSFLFAVALNGQEPNTKPPCKWNLVGIQVSGGSNHTMNYSGTYDQFQALAVNTGILTRHPYEDYQQFPSPHRYHTGGISAALDFRPGRSVESRRLNTPLIRLGVSYKGAGHHFLDAGRSDSYRYDTLYNAQGDQIGFRDSIIYQRYSMIYNSYHLQLDASVLYSTSAAHRVSLFGGFGVAGGLSTRAWVEIAYRSHSYRQYVFVEPGYTPNDGSWLSFDYDNEKEPTSGSTSAVIYLPMGVKVKLGKKGALADHLQLFYEIQPGIHTLHIRNSGTFIHTGVQQRLGFSVNW